MSSCTFNVNFNVNFNVLRRKCVVHPMVKIKKNFYNIRMHGTTTKIVILFFFVTLKIQYCTSRLASGLYSLSGTQKSEKHFTQFQKLPVLFLRRR